ncbi:MAG: S-layer homology domain-containing protein [Clostridia bacterium]|nr:S-layer homology domain-containing protein [Clostridia bacterium]
MKKVLSTTLIALCVICTMVTTCFAAAPDVQIISSIDNKIAVTGNSAPETFVSVTVLNPDYTEADFTTSPQSAIQYFSGTYATALTDCGHGGNYCFHIELTGEGGDYTIIVNADGDKTSQAFPFYPSDLKFDAIDDINDAADADAITLILDDVMEKFSLSRDPLYALNDVGAVAEIIDIMKTENGGEFGASTAEDLDNMYAVLKEACLIAAFNTDNEEILVGDDGLKYLADIMNLDGTDELYDYENCISDSGKDKLTDDLFDDTYESTEEIEEAFRDLIPFYVLVDYDERGYGHVEYYFDRYETFYEDVGFDLDKFAGKSGKNTIYSKVASSSATNITKLKNEFNRLLDGDGGSSSGNTGSYVPNNPYYEKEEPDLTPDIPATPVLPSSGYYDVADNHWASADVKALSEAGVISGRGDGNFDPDGTITRGELAKVIVMGIIGEVNKDAKSDFTDIDGHWSKEYIATAAAATLVNGMTATEFAPDGLVTREQAAVIIYRALQAKGYKFEMAANTFADIDTVSDWAKESVTALKGANIISGRDGNNFCPADSLTRAETAKLLNSIMNLK